MQWFRTITLQPFTSQIVYLGPFPQNTIIRGWQALGISVGAAPPGAEWFMVGMRGRISQINPAAAYLAFPDDDMGKLPTYPPFFPPHHLLCPYNEQIYMPEELFCDQACYMEFEIVAGEPALQSLLLLSAVVQAPASFMEPVRFEGFDLS